MRRWRSCAAGEARWSINRCPRRTHQPSSLQQDNPSSTALQGFFARIHTPISACALPLGLLGFLFGSGACILSRSVRRNVWRPETRSPAPVCFGRRCVGLHTKRSWTIGKMPIVPYPIRHHLSMHLRATISSIQCHGHTAVRPHPRALPVAVDPVIPRCASVARDGRWHPLARTCTPRPDLEYMYPNMYSLYASPLSGARRSPPPLSPHLCWASRRSPIARHGG